MTANTTGKAKSHRVMLWTIALLIAIPFLFSGFGGATGGASQPQPKPKPMCVEIGKCIEAIK